MNILVIGLGSMGKRRIRLLKKMYQQYHIYGVDLNAQRCAFVKKEYEMETFPTMEEAVSQRKFECAFVWHITIDTCRDHKNMSGKRYECFYGIKSCFRWLCGQYQFGKTKEQASLFIVYYDL